MSNNFVALSVVGGSLNTWGTTLNTLLQAGGIGALTAELYNDSGTLKLSKGKIGINNGVATGIGVCIIDTITTISTAGMTAGLWHAIEVSISGTAVTISITPIVGASDESVIDAATKAAYDYEKTGYYLTASKRLIGVVFLRAALALGRIVNCESGKLGFKGIRIENYIDSTGVWSKKYICFLTQETGDWNMNVADPSLSLTLNFIISILRKVEVWVRGDVGSTYANNKIPVQWIYNVGLRYGGGIHDYANTTGILTIYIDPTSSFHATTFDATSFNRGWAYVEFET